MSRSSGCPTELEWALADYWRQEDRLKIEVSRNG
jgi:hypothetical protein